MQGKVQKYVVVSFVLKRNYYGAKLGLCTRSGIVTQFPLLLALPYGLNECWMIRL
jgi:hypothetical protein